MTINIDTLSIISNGVLDTEDPIIMRDELVNMLRIISENESFSEQTVVIPEDCGQYGFEKGEFKLPELLYFLADMLE